MPKPPDDEDIARERDEVMKRLIATPPKAQKDEPKRRPTPTPIGKILKRGDATKRRDEA